MFIIILILRLAEIYLICNMLNFLMPSIHTYITTSSIIRHCDAVTLSYQSHYAVINEAKDQKIKIELCKSK